MKKFSLIIVLNYLIFPTFLQAQDYDLGANINTDKVEYAPSISADGNTLIFQSNRDGNYKLYFSERETSGKWSLPKPIINVNKFAEKAGLIGGPSISYDGNYIYFFANLDGGVGVEDIYYTERKGNDWSEPVNVGSPVNSRNYEGFPSISSDGKKLYFMRFSGKQLYEGKFCYQLWVSERDSDGKWGRPLPLPAPVNQGCEKCPRIMSDNETLIFSAIRGPSTKNNNFDLYMSRLDGVRWTEPVPLDFANTPDDEAFGSVPSSGDIMYLNVDNNGNQDLKGVPIPQALQPKKVINVKGKVTDAGTGKPIGANIIIIRDLDTLNTGALQSNPYDGNFTYVLTEGYAYEVIITAPGFNAQTLNYDLKELQDYKLINEVVNLTPYRGLLRLTIVNSLNKDTITTAVVTTLSNPVEGINGYYEIPVSFGIEYKIEMNAKGFEPGQMDFQVSDIMPKKVYKKSIELQPALPELIIVVNDKESGEKLKVYLEIFDKTKRTLKYKGMMEVGDYSGNLEHGHDYIMRITRPGYFFFEEGINLSEIFYGLKIEKSIVMTPLKKGEKLTLNNIIFELNSADLTQDSKTELDNVFELLKQNRNIVLEIAAHTDDLGDDTYNLQLSNARAKSVKEYLLSLGVPEMMLVSKGYGESMPAVRNDSEENRKLNRRVEFLVLDAK